MKLKERKEMNKIKGILLEILKAIPALLFLGLGVWLALGILFLFLLSGCAEPVYLERSSVSVPVGRAHIRIENPKLLKGERKNGKEKYNHSTTVSEFTITF